MLALALVFTAACGDDGDDTDGEDTDSAGMTSATATATATTPTGTTDPTSSTGPTTGDESSGTDPGTETGTVAVDYMADIQPIWDTKCVAGCHIESGIAQTNGPILTAEKSYGELIDVPSKTVNGIVQVKPGDPTTSYLWHKVNGTQANVGGLGLQMPQGGMLSAEELATIEAWIVAGAKP
jgi:hypothetical protein